MRFIAFHAKVALPQRLNPPPRTRVRNRCAVCHTPTRCMPIGATPMLGGVNTRGLLTRGCGWLALSSLIAAQAQTAATTTQTSAASANFAYVSDDGCILNEIIVFANRTTAVRDNTPRTTAEVTYTRYR